MGGNCEIVEEKFVPSTTGQTFNHLRSQERDKKPPIQKKAPNKFLEDDINKLFESVNLRTTKSLDLTDSWRNASKKPMRATGYHSPIGFSEPVSLKQALRGLCISQAAEMAAAKRLTSPRTSEVGKFSNLIKSATQSSCSSPSSRFQPAIKNIECISVGIPINETKAVEQIDDPCPQFHHIAIDNVSKPEKPISVSKKEASARIERSLVEVDKTTPKLRRKSRLQTVSSSSEVKSNKETNSTKSSSRAIKPVVIKKSVKLAVTNTRNSKALDEVNSGQRVCQKCSCSMKDAKISTSKPDYVPTITEYEDTASMKTISNEKVNISQSSKSSICDFSSSNTSLSEESNLSRSSFGTRPHMSSDMRWGAISRIKKHFGFLGLSHFNLLKKLGAGDIGTVYLAELIGTNCSFAIKVMDNEFLARRKKTARVQTEREILRMLDHPFLPTLFAQFTSDNLSCLVMEFCPGGDLHVLRQKQPDRYFPEQAARFYAAEVLLALEYLHMLGIIYRDLKPENIMVREDGHIMLTDFDLSLRCSVNPTLIRSSGIVEPPRMSGPCAGANCIDPFCAGPSCQMSCFTPRLLPTSARQRKLKAEARSLPRFVAEPKEARSNSFVGTHEYLAPEIIKGEGHGSAVDWWTFGILLYELLYGKTPFKGVGNDETLDNVILQNLKFPDSPIVSFQARDLIRGLLVKEPENRLGTEMGSAEIKRHPFFEGLNWALIRCAVPPQIPESYEGGGSNKIEYQGKEGHLEFELF